MGTVGTRLVTPGLHMYLFYEYKNEGDMRQKNFILDILIIKTVADVCADLVVVKS